MDTDTYPDAAVAELIARSFVAARVNGAERGDLVKRFAVKSYPTVLLLDDAEELVARLDLFLPADEFHARLADFLDAAAALTAGRAALREKPDEVTALAAVGDALVRLERPDEAGEPLEKALALDPKNEKGVGGRVRFALGNLALKRKNLERAATLLAEAAALDPEGKEAFAPELLYLLSNAEWQTGKQEAAKATLEKLATRYPQTSWGRRAAGYLKKIRGGVPGRTDEGAGS